MPVSKRKVAMQGRDEILQLARERKAEHGSLAKVDDEFASDMKKIHAEMNQPLDSSKWE